MDFSGGGGRGDDGEVGGLTGESAGRVRGDFNALDGGDFADRGGFWPDHALFGGHGNAYSQQDGGFIEHAGGPKWPKKQVE